MRGEDVAVSWGGGGGGEVEVEVEVGGGGDVAEHVDSGGRLEGSGKGRGGRMDQVVVIEGFRKRPTGRTLAQATGPPKQVTAMDGRSRLSMGKGEEALA